MILTHCPELAKIQFIWSTVGDMMFLTQIKRSVSMRVIITGGTGLIGSALTTDLVRQEHEVIVLSRNPQAHSSHLPPGATAEQWDGKSATGWGRLVDGAGAIINLAGENLAAGPWTATRKRAIVDSRVNAGQAITQAIYEAGLKPQVVIQSSAVGYYGSRGKELLTEESSPGSDYLSKVCVQWEASTAGVENLGVRRVVIRTGVVLSKQGGALPLFTLPFRFFTGGPLGSGRQWIPWIHIADEIAAIRFLLENPSTSGAYNLCAPDPLQQSEFASLLGGDAPPCTAPRSCICHPPGAR
jgi:uncharacterized protein (TIGR01777 family)